MLSSRPSLSLVSRAFRSFWMRDRKTSFSIGWGLYLTTDRVSFTSNLPSNLFLFPFFGVIKNSNCFKLTPGYYLRICYCWIFLVDCVDKHTSHEGLPPLEKDGGVTVLHDGSTTQGTWPQGGLTQEGGEKGRGLLLTVPLVGWGSSSWRRHPVRDQGERSAGTPLLMLSGQSWKVREGTPIKPVLLRDNTSWQDV